MKKLYKVKKGYLYLIEFIGDTDNVIIVKYGYSRHHPNKRLRYWKNKLRLDVIGFYVAECRNPAELENEVKYYTWSNHSSLSFVYDLIGSTETTLSTMTELITFVEDHPLFLNRIS